MDRTSKKEIVSLVREELEGVPSLIVASGVGIDANKMNDLRGKLRDVGAKYRVIKNTLARRVVEGTDLDSIAPSFVGPTAIVYHPEDAVAAAKVLVDFAKTEEKLEVRAGWLNGDVLDAAGVVSLSKMPGKDELRSTLLRTFLAGPTDLVRVLSAAPKDFLQVLNARKEEL